MLPSTQIIRLCAKTKSKERMLPAVQILGKLLQQEKAVRLQDILLCHFSYLS